MRRWKHLQLRNLISDSFLHTNDSQVALSSPAWHINTMNICIEMIIGLCAECQMEIVLVDASNESNNESMQIIKGSTVAVVHGLPMWQYVRINKTISFEFRKVARIKLTPSLEQKSLDPLWAVANVRMCPSLGMCLLNYLNEAINRIEFSTRL